MGEKSGRFMPLSKIVKDEKNKTEILEQAKRFRNPAANKIPLPLKEGGLKGVRPVVTRC